MSIPLCLARSWLQIETITIGTLCRYNNSRLQNNTPLPFSSLEKHSAKELTACCGTEYTSRSAKLSSKVALGNRSVTKLRNAIERLSMQLLITGAMWSVLWSSCSCSWLLLGWLSIGVSLYTFSMCFNLISSV